MNLDPSASSEVSEEIFYVNLTPKQISRFWSKTSKLENGCIVWNAARYSSGYGVIRLEKRNHATHRVSYFLKFGPFMKDSEICHHCDNPPCCNPNHLFIGTHTDNMRDMFSKNRRESAKGEKHGSAKLTPAQVIELRERYARGEGSMEILGAQYGITRQSAYLIISRQCWKHI